VVRWFGLGVGGGGECDATGGRCRERGGNPQLRSEQFVGHPLGYSRGMRGCRLQARCLEPDHRGRFAS
jgi:hypothetical protein